MIDASSLLQIYKVVPETAKINALIYAFVGVGKTIFASTAQDHPALADVLFLNLEGGLLSIAGRRDISAMDLYSADQLEQVLDMIAQGHPEMAPYKTLVLDSGSELYTMSLEHNIFWRQRNSATPDLDDVDRRDYGRTGVQLKRILRKMRDLPINFVMTAIPRVTKDDLGNIVDVAPSFSPSLQEPVMSIFDFVWYMYVDGDGVRQMLTRDTGVYRAKTRGPSFREALGVAYPNPTLPALYDLLLSSENGPLTDDEEDGGGYWQEETVSVVPPPEEPVYEEPEADPNTYDGMPEAAVEDVPGYPTQAQLVHYNATGEMPEGEAPENQGYYDGVTDEYIDPATLPAPVPEPEAPVARPAFRPQVRRPARPSATGTAMAAAKAAVVQNSQE